MSKYVTAQKTLNDKIQAYLTASSSDNKKYFNQNAKFSNGGIGYVTDKGVWKHYPNPDNYADTKGKNGCPAGSPVDMVHTQKFPTSRFSMGNAPKLMFGTNMKEGQACGNEGKNVYVTQMAAPGNVDATYEGCYKASNDSQGLVFQSDMGHKSTIELCALRASDMGLDGFALGKGSDFNNLSSYEYILFLFGV